MSKKPKPVSQTHIRNYCRVRTGVIAEPYMSAFLLACRALEMDGLPLPAGVQPKAWVYQNAAHILAAVGSMKAQLRVVPSTPKKPKAPKAMKAGKWTATASIPTFTGGRVDVRSADFLQTYEWRVLRMKALKLHGPRCQCCGATPADGVVMNVDHIKPRRLFPELALSLDNLQILCGPCNHGKSNWDETDWRNPEPELEPEQRAHLRAIA